MLAYTGRPTTYKGIQMRSRLEAATAGAFDRAGFRWDYEPQAFQGEDGNQYLPDFVLHGFDFSAIDFSAPPDNDTIYFVPRDVFVEVKPTLEHVERVYYEGTLQPVFDNQSDAIVIVTAPTVPMSVLVVAGGAQWLHWHRCRRCEYLTLAPGEPHKERSGVYPTHDECVAGGNRRVLITTSLVPQDYSKAAQ